MRSDQHIAPIGCSAEVSVVPSGLSDPPAVASTGHRRWRGMGESPSEEEVTDRDLQGEIELLGEVMAAAMACVSHLSASEVDQVLGVRALNGISGNQRELTTADTRGCGP
jgi:hypothetical protein